MPIGCSTMKPSSRPFSEALGRRHPRSRTRGRRGSPAEIVLRLLILKHVRNWSYEVLEREVRANLVYRDFTRVGGGKMPDAKTMGRWGLAVGPEAIKQIHERLVRIGASARDCDRPADACRHHGGRDQRPLSDRFKPARGRRTGADPGDEEDHRDRRRGRREASRPQPERQISRARYRAGGTRQGTAEPGRLKQGYGKLLASTSRVVGQAKRFAREIADGVKGARGVAGQLALEGLRQQLEEMAPRVRQVMKQARARIFGGDTHAEGKLLSLFEPSTEIIRKGKAAKPNEFGKMVKLQEAENQIVIDYEVYDRRPNDADLLIPAIDAHQARLGRLPYLVAADAAFYSGKNEAAAKAKGVKRVCVPNRSTKSSDRKREQKKRWFRNGQKWRTGSEGRISVVKRRHGLDRCRYKGDNGMRRWVGLGVIGDNLISIGNALAKRANL